MPSDTSAGAERHRIGELLRAGAVLPDGRPGGYICEVRLAGGPGLQDYVVDGLVVGPRQRGSLLGYDRREVQGPWLVRAAARLLNRNLGYVPWRAVRRIRWEDGIVEVDRVDPLTDERAAP